MRRNTVPQRDSRITDDQRQKEKRQEEELKKLKKEMSSLKKIIADNKRIEKRLRFGDGSLAIFWS